MGGDGNTSSTTSTFLFSEENMDFSTTSVFLVCLITVSLITSKLLHKIEHKVAETKAHKALLTTIYVEMIALGFISLALIFLIDFGPQNNYEFDKTLLIFEFAHLWMFFFGLTRVFHNMVGYKILTHFHTQWRIADATGIGRVMENPKKEKRAMDFFMLKYRFLTDHNRCSFNFDFPMYISDHASELLVEHLTEPSHSTWVILSAFSVILVYIVDERSGLSDVGELMVAFAFGNLNFFFSLWLMFTITNAKSSIISSYYSKKKKQGATPEMYPTILKEMQEIDKNLSYTARKKTLAELEQKGLVKSVNDKVQINTGQTTSIRGNIHKRKSISASLALLQEEPLDSDQEDTSAHICCGMTVRQIMYLNDLVTLFQCFYLGLFFTLEMSAVFPLLPTWGAVLYLIVVAIEQGLLMFWTSPTTVRLAALLECTTKKDNLFIQNLDYKQELYVLRISLLSCLEKSYPDKTISEAIIELFQIIYGQIESKKLFGGSVEPKLVKVVKLESLRSLYQKFDLEITSRQAKLMLSAMDTNVDNVSTIQEFILFLRDAEEGMTELRFRLRGNSEQDLKEDATNEEKEGFIAKVEEKEEFIAKLDNNESPIEIPVQDNAENKSVKGHAQSDSVQFHTSQEIDTEKENH